MDLDDESSDSDLEMFIKIEKGLLPRKPVVNLAAGKPLSFSEPKVEAKLPKSHPINHSNPVAKVKTITKRRIGEIVILDDEKEIVEVKSKDE